MHKTVDYHQGCQSHTKSNGTKHDSGLHAEAVLIWGKIKQRLCYVNKTQEQNNETKKTIQQVTFSLQLGSTAVDKFTALHSDKFICCFRVLRPPAEISVREVVIVWPIKVKHISSFILQCALLIVFIKIKEPKVLTPRLGNHNDTLESRNNVSIHTSCWGLKLFQICCGNLAVVTSCCQFLMLHQPNKIIIHALLWGINTTSNRLLTHSKTNAFNYWTSTHMRKELSLLFSPKGGARINNNRNIIDSLTVSHLCSVSDNN